MLLPKVTKSTVPPLLHPLPTSSMAHCFLWISKIQFKRAKKKQTKTLNPQQKTTEQRVLTIERFLPAFSAWGFKIPKI